jgi:uncharacterized protein (TIGR02118 family)
MISNSLLYGKHAQMIKVTILLRRNQALNPEQFVAHHKGKHAALFTSIAIVKDTVRGYVQQHSLGIAVPGLPDPKYDGATELWFDDIESFGRCFSDPEYMRIVRPDEITFLDLAACDFLISTQNVIVPVLQI